MFFQLTSSPGSRDEYRLHDDRLESARLSERLTDRFHDRYDTAEKDSLVEFETAERNFATEKRNSRSAPDLLELEDFPPPGMIGKITEEFKIGLNQKWQQDGISLRSQNPGFRNF